MDELDKEIAVFVSERNEAVESAIRGKDISIFKDFIKKYQDKGYYPPYLVLPDDNVLEASIRKMCIHIDDFSEELKNEARYWLITHGFTTDI